MFLFNFCKSLTYKPWLMLVFTVVLSLLCWAIPISSGLRKGFLVQEKLSFDAFTGIFLWYSFLSLTIFICFQLGRKIKLPRFPSSSLENITPYYVLTFMAILGTMSTILITIKMYGFSSLSNMLSEGQGNIIRHVIYDDGNYIPGLLSLRYVGTISGVLALFYIMRKQGNYIIHFINLFLLLFCTFSAGRVALVAAINIFITIYACSDWSIKTPLKGKTVILLGTILITFLSLINYARNANYYDIGGSETATTALLGEVVAYIGSPMQVTIGTFNNFKDIGTSHDYRSYVDVEESLTTNSAISDVYSEEGILGLIVLTGRIMLFTIIMGICTKHGNHYFLITSGTCLYAISELWRIDIFSKGFFLTLFLVSIISPLISRFLPRIYTKNSRKYPI